VDPLQNTSPATALRAAKSQVREIRGGIIELVCIGGARFRDSSRICEVLCGWGGHFRVDKSGS
jgi:hypothetical protein